MKLLKLLFLSLSCLFATIQQAYGYTAFEAFTIAKDSCGAQYDYYIGRTIYRVIFNNRVQYLRYNVVLVDLMPKAGWNHPCKLVYVPVDTNDAYPIDIIDADCPPANVSFNPALVHKDLPGTTEIRPSVPKIQSNAPDTAAAYASQHTYALIISGGVSAALNDYRYWNDCSFIYQTLRNRFDIPKSHIKVAMSDGTNTAADMNYEGRYISSPLDLDEDGEADIEYSATKSNISSILSAFDDSLTENDHLFIYVIDHGGLDAATNRSYISLWQFERLYSNELADMLSDVNAGFINVVMGQCHSGGFAEDLKANGRVITTACGKDELSYACEKIPFDEFVYRWTSAINGADAFGNTVNSDANSDGIVTMEEAFAYADANDIYAHGRHSIVQETPDTCSYTLSVVEDLAFNRIPELVDLYIRDFPNDTGKMPHETNSYFWGSPDLWARDINDGFENTLHQDVNFLNGKTRHYLYVRVTNRGTKPYTGSGKYLQAYWAQSSIVLSEEAWKGNFTMHDTKSGGSMDYVELDERIAPGESKIYELKFEPRSGTLKHLSNDPKFHACYLAVISDTSDEEYYPEDEYGLVEVWKTNDMAQKNQRNIFDRHDFDGIAISSPLDTMLSADIAIVRDFQQTHVEDCFERKIQLSPNIGQIWQNGGNMSINTSTDINNNNVVNLLGDTCRISNIMLPLNAIDTLGLSVELLANDNVTEHKTEKFDVILIDRSTGRYLGGETYEISFNPRSAINTTIETIPEFARYTLQASVADEDATYEWYDSEGILIGTGRTIRVSPSTDETYTVRVKANSDGAVSYSEVSVPGMRRIDEVLVSEDNINVKLNAQVQGEAQMVLSSSTNNIPVSSYAVPEGESDCMIPISGLSSGVYQVTLKSDGKTLDSRKISIKK